MDFQLSLLIIQTLTGIISVYLAFKGINLTNQFNRNINQNYTNNGIHNQNYTENIVIINLKEIQEKKERYIKYFHWVFNISFFGTGIYTLFKMFPLMIPSIRIFDGGITLTNIIKLLILSLQNALLGSLIINILGGIILIIFTIIKPGFSKKRIPLSIIIVFSNIIIFLDLLVNKYHENMINVFNTTTNTVNFLIVIFVLFIMMLVVANNMVLAIYLFDLDSYNGQLKDPIIRLLIIISTIFTFILIKWIIFHDGLTVILEAIKNYFN